MIKFIGASKSYGRDISAVKDINLHIAPGEFISIVGRSGSGKTTLVKILIGEERLDKGKIIIGDWDITRIRRSNLHILRKQIGVIFQDYKLLPNKTLRENVSFAMQVCGENPFKVYAVVPQLMKIVGLENKMNRYPREVSGGERQRAAIARALVHKPKVLLADEPTGNLDSINADEIIELLLKINKFGTTVVLVTHNKDVVNKLRKRVITIDNGSIIHDQAVGKYIL